MVAEDQVWFCGMIPKTISKGLFLLRIRKALVTSDNNYFRFKSNRKFLNMTVPFRILLTERVTAEYSVHAYIEKGLPTADKIKH